MNQPLSADQIEKRLQEILGAVLSSRRTASEPAAKLSTLQRDAQDYALHWASVISKSNSEMAFQFVSHAAQAFHHMEMDGVTQWIIEAMDVYDRQGLYPGSASLREVESFAGKLVQKRYLESFENVVGVLDKYVRGLSGRDIDLRIDEQAWTDTETIYLPEFLNVFGSQSLNFQLYKATGAFLLAQARYGTFQVDEKTGIPHVCYAISKYRDQARALRIFEIVEEVRLLKCISSELPGLARQMKELKALNGKSPQSELPQEPLAKMRGDDLSVLDSLRVLEQLYHMDFDFSEPNCYQGVMHLDKVQRTVNTRVEREKEKFRADLAMLAEQVTGNDQDQPDGENGKNRNISMSAAPEENESGAWEMQISIDGETVNPPDEMIQTANSIIQDFGKIPDDYLSPANDGQYNKSSQRDEESDQDSKLKNSEAYYYDEWDFRRCHYRKNWCVLKEFNMQPANEGIVDEILQKYVHLVRDIRKTFEALRGDDKLLKRQKIGDDIDIDAVVEGYIDICEGRELTDRLFIKSRRLERNLAVMFMVDVSGSTKGWINEAERESLILLSEALQVLGDRYAIYGFSGMTRKRCEVYRIKEFDEPYNSAVKSRIAGIRPQDYTRMGVVIRHLKEKLMEVDAKTKVLITISDGKPDDYDGYRGDYGIEDTRKALMEAKHAGIHPFCITIDTQAHAYLSHMYGHVNYTVVSDVRKLPLKISDIYRKLTS